MTFTYTAGATTTLNDIRLLIGDTDDQAQLDLRLEDEEINRLVTLEGATHFAAAAAAEALASKFARRAEGSAGPDRVQPGGRAMELRMLASRLRARGGALAVPVAPGISVSGKASAEADSDRPPAPFKRGMMTNPDAGEDLG